ncbi:histidine triad protein D [Streptococcus pneumoniae]|nr:histidine triad protein D [Streptococcus pneumoniae]CIS06112.1 histidine triad protein D [Streptococcus pneumoniae]CIX18913.1 histidine triad protein D [Streptococcus pneumoniae]CJB30108.1 histidine triad protein D [Streptococcus pneumoniae]COJ88627.1 histidine triad protein D [Streptococcus pneumoniae]
MKINKKYLAGSVAVLALSVCSYELGRYQAGQDKKESNRVAYIDGDQAGQKAENLTPDEVSKREGINAEQIVIKITDQGYVTSHGDHYHYYNGKVKVSGRRYQRISLVAGLTNGELIAPMTYEETMTSDFFEAWFQKFLLPTLTAPSVIIVK